MTTPEERITALEIELQDLRDFLATLVPLPAPPPPPPPPPQRWAARATPDDWNDLMDWVDGLTVGYSLFGDYGIVPCWPSHPGVVEELAAMWRAWIAAAVADDAAGPDGSNALNAWHDKVLWPALRRLERTHYATSSCRDKHEPDRIKRPLTDRSGTR